MARIYDSRKRILVTGGAGFLGSHLVDRLLGQGHEVLCVDNLFTGTKRNIEHLHSHPRFEFIERDLLDGVLYGGTLVPNDPRELRIFEAVAEEILLPFGGPEPVPPLEPESMA